MLARDRSATLPQIALAADVGRTTLHRYFPERDGLVNAAVDDSLELIGEAIREAAPHEGGVWEAMRRLVAALASVSDRIMFVFGDPSLLRDLGPTPAGQQLPDDPVLGLIRRGQADGVFDAEVSAGWLQQVLWALLYTAFEQVERGTLARYDVVPTVLRTLERGITATGSA
ncbi:transcriptional regulator, TetR family [Goodfellowiella coeruleoviolacea]|uniref:Transcriptional regulator, TetR family n=1 Tax=Goodfellowiella coeruleoviolacea TaxID=334858 RepID=A0AAE3GDE5_9PSEU|nr:transcriptional regulator, TetR family [Goodfellowiella coeruleoviolacea]